MKVISSGNTYEVFDDTLCTYDKFPAQSYVVRFSKFKGFYLEKYVDIEINEEKIYGVHTEKVDKVLKAFNKFNRNLLNGLDHFITEKLQCKYYGRYMDDFYLLSDNKEYLQYCLAQIKSFLSKLYLTLNDKTEIVPMSKGIRFLGFHSYLTEDGKVIRKLTGDNKRQIKKRLRKNAHLVKKGKMSREKFDEKYNSWKNHASHGNCYKLICSMDEFVESLFTNKENTNQ